MSFGGSAQAMITTLKNNEKMRSKRDKFKKTMGGYGSKAKPEYDFPEATPKVLNDIRNKLQKERKIRKTKVFGLTALIIIVLIWMLFSS